MNNIAIKTTVLSKKFKLYDDNILGPLKEYLLFWNNKKYYQSFWAVKNASIEIKKGEVIGIIGPNGAGKTTFLKIIAGLLRPDKGEVKTYGKITALLALGIGFHPEFTGRENILYGGMLLGMSKKEIMNKMDSIIQFAEIGDYIERPLRTYSSGMKARLIFSVSMSIDPEILIIDEALATGDSYFIQKSSQRIHEIVNSGATILFVSHNLNQIQELCGKVFLMNKGEIIDEGLPQDVIKKYKNLYFEEAAKKIEIQNKRSSNNCNFNTAQQNEEVQITKLKTYSSDNKETNVFRTGDNMYIELQYRQNIAESLNIDLRIFFRQEITNKIICSCNTQSFMNNGKLDSTSIILKAQGIITLKLEPLLLASGHYFMSIRIVESSNKVLKQEKGRILFDENKIHSFFAAQVICPMYQAFHFQHPFALLHDHEIIYSKCLENLTQKHAILS